MENKKWLPADTRNRLLDLCKSRKISQSQLAGVLGVDRSALSRFLSGKTDSLSHEHVIAIANYFNVTTDFLLGETDDPGRINYDIGELGLTVKAAECLYTRKVDPVVLCKLLEHERCGELMHEIGLYLDETMAAGIAAQNQLFNSLSNLLRGHAAEHPEDKPAAEDAAQTVLAMRQPLYTERDRILSDVDQMLVDIKRGRPSTAKQAAFMTRGTMEDMIARLQKGSQGFDLHITPEELADSILGQLDMAVCPGPKMDRLRPRLREDLIEYFTLMEASKEQDG
ncbi:MAG: helix-turn-helix transcriptional regulator [Clostridia bacterium]|nr:helix-turn-helix transcriptional regulator [Clostridia bacterium]